MIKKEYSILTRLDQCQQGLWIKNKEGWLLAKKPTEILTNSPCVAQQLAGRRPGKHSHSDGRHASLFNGRAKKAQVYPDALCDAICRGIKEQIEQDRKGQFVLAGLTPENPESGMRECQQISCNLADANFGTGRRQLRRCGQR